MTEAKEGAISEECMDGVLAFWRRSWQWLLIGALGTIALVLGVVGFGEHAADQKEARSFLDNLYLALQLFSFQAGDVPGPIPWKLEVARLLAPVVPAWAVLRALVLLFHEKLQMLRLKRMRGHVVVCGLGRKGFQFVKDFRARGDEVVVIEMDEGNARIGNCRDLGAVVLLGDATEEAQLRKARVECAAWLLAVGGDDGTNVEIAVRAYRLVRARPPDMKGSVRCFVHVVDLTQVTQFHRLNGLGGRAKAVLGEKS